MRNSSQWILAILLSLTAVANAASKYTKFDPPGSRLTSPAGINDTGAVAGFYVDSAYYDHGFLRTADGAVTSFDPPDSTGTIVTGINAKGAIAGYFSDASYINHGFLRHPSG